MFNEPFPVPIFNRTVALSSGLQAFMVHEIVGDVVLNLHIKDVVHADTGTRDIEISYSVGAKKSGESTSFYHYLKQNGLLTHSVTDSLTH